MWLKKSPINLFSLALLIVALYFTIFVSNFYAIGAFVFFYGLFFEASLEEYGSSKVGGTCWWVLFDLFFILAPQSYHAR